MEKSGRLFRFVEQGLGVVVADCVVSRYSTVRWAWRFSRSDPILVAVLATALHHAWRLEIRQRNLVNKDI